MSKIPRATYRLQFNHQFTFNDAAVRVPSARQMVYADARADARGRVPDNTWILRPQDLTDSVGRSLEKY